MRPAISYIVPVFNYGNFLGPAVESICAGNLEHDDEILIVNDASTDDTSEVIRELASRIPQVKSVTHRHNKGCSTAGYNTAIEIARHDLFFGLAADNLLVPDSMGPLTNFMLEKKVDLAAFQEIRFFTTNTTAPTHSWYYQPEYTLADALAGHEWPGASGHYIFTRESWLKARRCDEFLGGLDSWGFGIQQLATGSTMVTLPNSYYLHRWGHESLWKRESKKGDLSLKALRVLLPFLELLEQESVDYLFSAEGRVSWFENLPKHPLRLKGQDIGTTGQTVRHRQHQDPFFKRLRRFVARKIAPELRG